MINKVIHYCWFGNGEFSPLIKKCIASWKKYCPDYEIIEWNESNFDVNSVPWTREAYAQRKFAFVSDYVRLHVLYHYGGIYLDTDVELTNKIDNFLIHEGFSGFENNTHAPTGIIGSVKNHKLIKEFLDYYNELQFINKDRSIKDTSNVKIMTSILEKYGFEGNNSLQHIKKFMIYPRTYFCPIDANGNRDFSKNTYCIHHFSSSWRTEEEQRQVKFMHKWYFPIYRRTLILIIKLTKIVIGKSNVKKLKTLYQQKIQGNLRNEG